MTMLKELAAELIGMFVSESRLTLFVLAIVAVVGLLVNFSSLNPLLGGVALLLGCLLLLVESVLRAAKPRNS
jgi:Co/Zn/Cd efflux system component